jgi:hypothetical protein
MGVLLSHPKTLECEINKIGTMYVCIDLNFTRISNFLNYLKALLEKPIQTFYYSLKNSIEKIRFQNTILYPMQVYLQMKYVQNVLH